MQRSRVKFCPSCAGAVRTNIASDAGSRGPPGEAAKPPSYRRQEDVFVPLPSRLHPDRGGPIAGTVPVPEGPSPTRRRRWRPRMGDDTVRALMISLVIALAVGVATLMAFALSAIE